jgi:hypothetical protein
MFEANWLSFQFNHDRELAISHAQANWQERLHQQGGMGAGFNNLLCRSLLFLLPLPSPQLLSITFHPARTSLPVFYFWLVSILRFMKQLVPVWIGNSGLQSHTGVRNPGALFFWNKESRRSCPAVWWARHIYQGSIHSTQTSIVELVVCVFYISHLIIRCQLFSSAALLLPH